MSTYIALAKHTQESKENIDTVPDWYEQAIEYIQTVGAEPEAAYYGSIGEYDALFIFEVSDGKKAEMIRLTIEAFGTHHIELAEVFDSDQYFEMIDTAIN